MGVLAKLIPKEEIIDKYCEELKQIRLPIERNTCGISVNQESASAQIIQTHRRKSEEEEECTRDST